MAGTIPLSFTQQLDEFGKPLAGGRLFIIQAGTTSAPQNGFQDSALTLPWPNPIILDASGYIPQFFLADGSIKVRLTDTNGVEKRVADGLIVTGASSGGGGGSPVDPTTVLQTGWLTPIYGTGIVTGFVRCNARTIGSSTSSATERANADTQALFTFLWNADPNLAVSTGRGANAAADWSANKNIALPDFRGRALAGLDDMGNSAAGRLTTAGFGASAIVLGASGGAETVSLAANQIPAGVPASGNNSISVSSSNTDILRATVHDNFTSVGGDNGPIHAVTGNQITSTNPAQAIAVTTTNASQQAVPNVTPTMLATIYIKL